MKKKKEKDNSPSFMTMMKRMLQCVRQYRNSSIAAMVFIAFEAAFECVIPYIMSLLLTLLENYESGLVEQSEYVTWIAIYAVLLVVLAMCSLAAGILSARSAAKASVGFATNLRKDVFYKTLTFSFNNIDKFSVASLVTRQTTDIHQIQMCYQSMVRTCLRAPLMLIFSVVMAVVMAAQMSWIYAITIPVLAIALVIIVMNVVPIFMKMFDKFDKLNESIEENVHGIRTVKTYNREEYEKQKFDKAADNITRDATKGERIIALNHPVQSSCMYLSMILIIFFGAFMIIDNRLMVGQVTALITFGAQILSSLMMFSMIMVQFSMSMACFRRVYEILVEEPTITDPGNAVTEVKDGSIRFDHVSFKYKAEAEKFALADVNLDIHSGDTVGIIGGTGSSKSTLVNLISRFYDVSEGSIEVGGVDVRNYDLKALRTQVSMVLQKNVLFAGTIKENLRWGNNDATDEEIVEACRIAQADSFIEQLPNRYDYQITQGGSNVSGGQKQRLCIARAILKKPKVLILDDSTSAVDTKTDAFIRQGLKTTMKDTTKIIIAQRVSSVQDSDYIVVLDDGKVTGVGTHEELLQNNPIYKEIYEIQNSIGGAPNVQ